MHKNEFLARIRLGLAKGIGPKQFHNLLVQWSTAEKILQVPRFMLALTLSPEAIQNLLCTESEKQAKEEIRKTTALGAAIIPFGHSQYPDSLAEAPCPPPLLWCAGKMDVVPGIALVGKRAASGDAVNTARKTAQTLAQKGFTVISGGAYGIDAAAHAGCLDAGGPTICVLGSSLDRPYPARNLDLFKEAVNSGGAVISHLRLGTEPHRGCFLQRNRIIAALSRGVCVVEAGLRSGAKNTAAHAKSLKIPVMAFPGSPGTMQLLADGAYRVENARQILDVVVSNKGERGVEAPDNLDENLSRLLCAAAVPGGRTPDDLGTLCGMSPAQTLSRLTVLEMEELILRLPGNRYAAVHNPSSPTKNKIGGLTE